MEVFATNKSIMKVLFISTFRTTIHASHHHANAMLINTCSQTMGKIFCSTVVTPNWNSLKNLAAFLSLQHKSTSLLDEIGFHLQQLV